MTITRRRTLGFASAFALIGATEGGLAAALPKKTLRFRNLQSAQSFMLLLIHHDEGGDTPHSAPIWIPSSDTAWYAVDTMSPGLYAGNNKTYKKRGYRLERVSAFKTKEGERYAAIWELASGPEWHSRHGMIQAEFEQAHSQFGKNWRMAHVNAHHGFAAIWEKGDGSTQQVVTALSASDFQTQMAQLTSQGLRPLRISTSSDGHAPRFTAIFEKTDGTEWQAQSAMNESQFAHMSTTMSQRGFKLVDASGVMLGKKPSFSGIWEKV